jgi:hypothetical protein
MQYLRALAAASVAMSMSLGVIGSAHAQSVKPTQSQSIDLGRVTGDIYYTVRPDGYHVVATFAELNEDATPVRFETVLAPNQSVKVSTPRHIGEAPVAVEISRQSDQVYVRKAAEIN